jgi:hypothetical protein
MLRVNKEELSILKKYTTLQEREKKSKKGNKRYICKIKLIDDPHVKAYLIG